MSAWGPGGRRPYGRWGAAYDGLVTSQSAPKKTRVVRALTDERARSHSVELPVRREDFEAPTWIPRLSFRPGPKIPIDQSDYLTGLEANREAALFVDSSIFDSKADPALWSELLSKPARVYFTPRVVKELLPFFRRYPKHPMLAPLRDQDPAVVWHPEPESGSPALAAQEYYVHLLMLRRFPLEFQRQPFSRKHGREPTPAEEAKMVLAMQKILGERGMLLYRKPPSPYLTDEVLVYLAVAHAVATGQDTTILTADLDIEEQFYKLIELITMHYFGMRLGELYERDFAAFSPKPVPAELLACSPFLGHGGATIDLGGRGIHDFVCSRPNFVPVSCLTIGREYLSQLTYGAETQMQGVIDVKARTKGLSTDRLKGRNVHPWLIPLMTPEVQRGAALVAFDRREALPDSEAMIARVDQLHALSTTVNFAPVKCSVQSSKVLLRRRARPGDALS